MINTTINYNLKINSDTILFFDMDGTLVDTDFANFLSYKEAIQSVVKLDKEISYNPNQRFNRIFLKELFPNLTDDDYQKIIIKKEENYIKHIALTEVNKKVVDILTEYFRTNKTVLITNCQENRAFLTLNHHNLLDKFTHLFYGKISENGQKINKYENAIKQLKVSNQNILLFENEKVEINNAVLAGISIDNIIKI